MNIIIGDYREALPDVKADLIFTSPPYNIGEKKVSEETLLNGRDRRREEGRSHYRSCFGINQYADKRPEDEYQKMQVDFLQWAAEHLADGGTLAYNHKLRQVKGATVHPMVWICRVPGLTLFNEIILERPSTHMHGAGQIHNRTERLYILRRADDKSWKIRSIKPAEKNYTGYLANYVNPELQDGDDTDIWPMKIQTGAKQGTFDPAIVGRGIRLLTSPGQLVCDPYAGSGTTGRVAEALGRRFIGAEINEDRVALQTAQPAKQLAMRPGNGVSQHGKQH